MNLARVEFGEEFPRRSVMFVAVLLEALDAVNDALSICVSKDDSRVTAVVVRLGWECNCTSRY